MTKLLLLLLSASVLTACERAGAEQPAAAPRAPASPAAAGDTVDFWHVYVGDSLVLRDRGPLALGAFAPGDTLRVVYFTDTGTPPDERLTIIAAPGHGRRSELVFEPPRPTAPQRPQDLAFAVPVASLPRAGSPYRFEYESTRTPRRLLFEARYD